VKTPTSNNNRPTVVPGVPGAPGQAPRGRAAGFLLGLALLLTLLAKFVPFRPEFPGDGLDSSWSFAMNYALAHGMGFGRDIIFTFGPYAAVYTRMYHPATDLMMLASCLFLALWYWFCFGLLIRSAARHHALYFLLFLACLLYSQDALLFSIPLLAALVLHRIGCEEQTSGAAGRRSTLLISFVLLPFGLLPLVKGSLLLLCGAIALACAVLFLHQRHRRRAALCVLVPGVAMLFLWIVSGQALTDLPRFFISIRPIIAGYTEAMAVTGHSGEIGLYGLAATAILLLIWFQAGMTAASKLFLSAIFGVYLFLAFKAGFVRDDGHSVISAASLLFAGLFLPYFLASRRVLQVRLLCLLVWGYIDGDYVKTSTDALLPRLVGTYQVPWSGLTARFNDPAYPRTDYDAALRKLRQIAPLPALPGTTDIYSYHQSYLLASDNTWSPRPVLQSYSVYKPQLAELNRQHLLGSTAPDNILFSVEAIDGRLPSIEDGASWPLLLQKYAPTRMLNGALLLQRTPATVQAPAPVPLPLGSKSYRFGASIALPPSAQPVYAAIAIRPTLMGRLAGVFFKPSQLHITLTLQDGGTKTFRFSTGMVLQGAMVSPLIENTEEFGKLYGEGYLLDRKKVRSFVITHDGEGRSDWQDEFIVNFSTYAKPAVVDLWPVLGIERFTSSAPANTVRTLDQCDGALDVLNEVSPVPAQLSAAKMLTGKGWLAARPAADKPSAPGQVYLVLTDPQGGRRYARTSGMTRPDVANYFSRPELSAAGFSLSADVSDLRGDFTLGLAQKTGEVLGICPQFKTGLRLGE
jgi:hypothetical protein